MTIKTKIRSCRSCKTDLNESNWADSRQRKRDYLCSPCASKKATLKRKLDPEYAEKMRAYFRERSRIVGKTEARKEYEKDYRNKNSEHIKKRNRNWRLIKEYGITSEDYDRMLLKQNYACAICKTTIPGGINNRWHIDHCHSTGVVRGLLCMKCNQMIGIAGENIETLINAIDYIKKYRNTNEG